MRSNDTAFHAIRLLPGQDLKREILAYVLSSGIQAGWVITCVGSLRRVELRLANQNEGSNRTGFFEILSLSGTLSREGLHLHLAVADEAGQCWGGHLLDGCEIYTTAELVIGESKDLIFRRVEDESAPWKELSIQPGDPEKLPFDPEG